MSKVWKLFVVFTFTLFVIGCGGTMSEPENAPEPLQDDVREFENTYNVDTSHIEVRLEDTGYLGRCTLDENGDPLILISTRMARDRLETRQELTLFHEFGHCQFSLGHDEGMVRKDGENIPRSIMYPEQLEPDVYLRHEAYYHDQLDRMRSFP